MKAKDLPVPVTPSCCSSGLSKCAKCGTPCPRTRTGSQPWEYHRGITSELQFTLPALLVVSIHQREAYLRAWLREALALPCPWNTANPFQKLVSRTFFDPKLIEDTWAFSSKPRRKMFKLPLCSCLESWKEEEMSNPTIQQKSTIQSPVLNHCQRNWHFILKWQKRSRIWSIDESREKKWAL